MLKTLSIGVVAILAMQPVAAQMTTGVAQSCFEVGQTLRLAAAQLKSDRLTIFQFSNADGDTYFVARTGQKKSMNMSKHGLHLKVISIPTIFVR